MGVIRHAVAVSDWDEQKSVIDLLQAGRSVLKNWAANKLRADIILSLSAVTADGKRADPLCVSHRGTAQLLAGQ